MKRSKILISFLLLSAYLLVLLHNIIPHYHIEGGHEIAVKADHSDHSHHHSQEHEHHHEHDQPESNSSSQPEEGMLHSLAHLLGDMHHVAVTENHLTHIQGNQMTLITANPVVIIHADLFAELWPPGELAEHKKLFHPSPPILEQLVYATSPLRAPPVIC